jgi:hypothetical protein
MFGRFVRWLLRRSSYVRELEQRNARHERLEHFRGRGLGPMCAGTPEDIRRTVEACLAERMPLGIAWDVTVCELSPGYVGVGIDFERKAGRSG